MRSESRKSLKVGGKSAMRGAENATRHASDCEKMLCLTSRSGRHGSGHWFL